MGIMARRRQTHVLKQEKAKVKLSAAPEPAPVEAPAEVPPVESPEEKPAEAPPVEEAPAEVPEEKPSASILKQKGKKHESLSH